MTHRCSQTSAYVAPGVEHAEVERVLLAEIERVKKDGVTSEEVATAIGKYTAATAFGATVLLRSRAT